MHSSQAVATLRAAAGCDAAWTSRNRSMLTLVYRWVVSSRA
jgi:hypothetical protein